MLGAAPAIRPIPDALKRQLWDILIEPLRVEGAKVLAEALPEVDDVGSLSLIIRTLSKPEAKGLVETHLLDLFERLRGVPNTDRILWNIGLAIHELEPRRVAARVLAIAGDESLGFVRQMFVMSLWRLDEPEVEPIIVRLLDQADVAMQAISAAKRCKAKAALPKLRAIAEFGTPSLRRPAKTAIKAISDHNPTREHLR